MRLATALLLIASASAMAQPCPPLRYLQEVFEETETADGIHYATALPYGSLLQQQLRLDFYGPAGDTLPKRPLIIYAFGGGFLIGTRFQPPIPEFCRTWARMGYAVAAIDYRIGFNTASTGSAERAVYRGVQDMRAAMRYLAHHAEELRIDTSFIFLTGSSAGCFSALHSTFMEEGDRPESTYGMLLEPADLGCADCSGNSYLNNQEIRPKGIINHWGALLDTLFIDPGQRDNVPVISFHGTDDLIVPYGTGYPFSLPIFPPVHGSEVFHARLSNLGITNTLVALDGIGHEPWLLEPRWLDTVYAHAPPFLYEIMRPQAQPILGQTTVGAAQVFTYTVSGQAGSRFCWQADGGTVVAQSANTADILWQQPGAGQVRVSEVSYLEVAGLEQALDVEISGTTSDVTISGLGVISLHPNPATDAVRISGIADGTALRYSVADLCGRMALSGSLSSSDGVSMLSGLGALRPGSYVLRLEQGGTGVARRLTIAR